jgi:hypothetical protein
MPSVWYGLLYAKDYGDTTVFTLLGRSADQTWKCSKLGNEATGRSLKTAAELAPHDG